MRGLRKNPARRPVCSIPVRLVKLRYHDALTARCVRELTVIQIDADVTSPGRRFEKYEISRLQITSRYARAGVYLFSGRTRKVKIKCAGVYALHESGAVYTAQRGTAQPVRRAGPVGICGSQARLHDGSR